MRGLFILLKKSWYSTRNLRLIVREHSSFKVLFTLSFASLVLFGLFALFLEGFMFIDTLGGVGLVLIPKLFALFFFGLAIMLVLSSIVTSYSSFYRAEDLPFLLLRPLHMREIVLYKYLEATLYSTWAFFFIIVPFIGAYAWHEELSWVFSIWTVLFSVPFVLVCSAIGTLITVVAIRFLPRGRWLFIGIGAVLVGAGVWFLLNFGHQMQVGQENALVLSSLVPGLQLASNPLWPSWWVAEGIMALSREQWSRGLMLLMVLFSNLCLLIVLVETVGSALFYGGWQRVLQAMSGTKRRGVLLRRTERAMGVMPVDMRAVMVKDMRTFLRDAAQWSQGLLFFGLLGIYFLNLRNLHYHNLPVDWRNLIAFLNVFSVSAVLASLGCRFVYPQLSLEGHSFWILGMSPVSMGRVLMAKFLLALICMTTVSVSLMVICVKMLAVQAFAQWVSLALAVCVSMAVAGLSTGLGAIFIDLKQRNPSAIVSGFGGTLDLVLSLAYIICTMFPFAILFHLHNRGTVSSESFLTGLFIVSVWTICATILATAVPLILGRRSLMKQEY